MISFFHGSCSEKCTFNYLVEHKNKASRSIIAASWIPNTKPCSAKESEVISTFSLILKCN